MGAHHELFVRPVSNSRRISDVGEAIAAPLEPNTGQWNREVDYAGSVGGTKVQLSLSHAFDEDRGMPFESYPVRIHFRDIDADAAHEEAVAREVFARLRERGHALLLAFDLQRLVDRCDP